MEALKPRLGDETTRYTLTMVVLLPDSGAVDGNSKEKMLNIPQAPLTCICT